MKSFALLLVLAAAAQAGPRVGGTYSIVTDTLDSGGRSAAGGVYTMSATSLGGVVGISQVPAAQEIMNHGYIGQLAVQSSPPPTGYAQWAATNIPAGKDATFAGDWNGDGILNGASYLFGATRITTAGKGRLTAPPAIPADVDVYLDRSTTMSTSTWTAVGSWVNAAAPVFASGVTLVGGEVRDTFASRRAYYRYRIVKR